MDSYRLGTRAFYASDLDPALSARIAPHVQSVVGLSNLARPVRVGSLKEIMEYQEQLKRDGLEGNLAYSCWLALSLANMPGISVPESLRDAMTDPLKDELLKAVGISYSLHQVAPAVTYLRYMCAADELNLLNRLAAGLPIPEPVATRGLPRPASTSRPRSASVTAATASTLPGAGQTIGLLEFDNFHPSDVQDFLNLIGQGTRFSQLSQIHVNGGAGPPGADQSEVLLDIAAVMSLAPGANVVVYDGPFTGRGSFQAMLSAMIDDGVNVISNSWAYCEDQTTLADVQSLDSLLASAAAAGITVLTGSGDRGSTCLNGSPNTVHVPASAPHITAVGATSSARNVGGTFGSETWWDGSTFVVPGGQSGFGTSAFFTRPSYQNGLSTASMRSIPDVTAPADPATGYFICQASAGGCPTNLLYGGTSVAAPIWAAIVAVLNQQGGQPLGFLNPLLYPRANTIAFHSAVELGSDFAHVGLGSPNVGELYRALTGSAIGSISTDRSVVGAFPVIVPADGTTQAGVVVMAVDAGGNTISGQAVQLTMNAGSHAVITALNATTNTSNGAALFLVTNTVPETVTFTASVGGVTLPRQPAVRFVSPPRSE